MKPEKMGLESMDLKEKHIEDLKRLFPSVVTEGKVDFERLKQILGEEIETSPERYRFTWPGKSKLEQIIQEPSLGALVPDREESVNFDTTENLFIEGDNLEVLKLLQKSYFGKVKMIYIDPPYNTGKEFIYPDKYSEGLQTYLEYTGQVDAHGKKFSTNTESVGRYHTNWLNMMYPRLELARNLLRDDGVIFMSIGNDELTNLRKIADEIYGEDNFIECITWNKRVPKNDKGIGNIHEYILVYVNNPIIGHRFRMPKEGLNEVNDLLKKLKRQKVPLKEAEQQIKKLYLKRGFDRGITLYNSLDNNYELWGKINLSWPNAETFGPRYVVVHPKTKKPVKIPDRGWRWKKETFDSCVDYNHCIELYDGSFVCGAIWFDKDENTQPSSVKYLKDVNDLLLRSVISLKSDGGIEIEGLFGGKSHYSYPKPTSIIKFLTQSISTNNSDIFLDFFAGSGTTAHAVMALNAEDGGNRKCISVQLPEPCDEKSEAYKAGYKTIADIGKERIRRAANKILDDNKDNPAFDKDRFDSGFKVFKLRESNFKVWDDMVDGGIQQRIESIIDHVKHDASEEAILYEILTKAGFELTAKKEKREVDGTSFYSVADGNNALFICLDNKITAGFIKKLSEEKPMQVICLESGFERDDELTNAAQYLKTKNIEFKVV